MKTVLLVCNILSEGSTANFVLHTLSELNCRTIVWDTRLTEEIPTEDYDLAIIWTNAYPEPEVFKDHKVVFYYLDDATYYLPTWNIYIDKVVEKFKNVHTCNLYTCMQLPKYEKLWLPMGCIEHLHTILDLNKIEKQMYTADVSFIGTCRDNRRQKFIVELAKLLEENNISFKLYGNNWGPQFYPVYFDKFSKVVSASKLVVTQHFNLGTSTKDFELTSIGRPIIMDRVRGVTNIFKEDEVIYYDVHNIQDAFEKIKHYLEHYEEAEKIGRKGREKALNYTYKKQLKKLLELNV